MGPRVQTAVFPTPVRVTGAPMTDIQVPERDQRRGALRPAEVLVGRDAELAALGAFLDAARTDGGAILVTGEPGVGKSELLDAAADHAASAGTRDLGAGRTQFGGGMSYSGPHPT